MSSITQKTRKPLALVATAALALFMSAGFALPANAGEGDEVYTTVVDPIPPTAPTCESDGPIVPEQPEGVIVSYENGGLTVVFTADTGYKFFEETQTVYPFSAPEGCESEEETEEEEETPMKVFVCKYVGTPGVDETLQTGQNPISVSVSSIQNNQWDGSVPGWFSDAHDRSYVIAYDTGQEEPSCPEPEGPPPSFTVVDPIPPTAPTCESDGPIVPEQPEGVIVSYENGGLTVVFTADTGYKFFEETQTVYEFEAPADCDLPDHPDIVTYQDGEPYWDCLVPGEVPSQVSFLRTYYTSTWSEQNNAYSEPMESGSDIITIDTPEDLDVSCPFTVVDPIPPTAPTCESDGPIVPEQPEGVIVSYENGGLTVVFTADTGYKFFEETQTVYEFEAPADCDLPVESENPAGSSTLAETGSTDTAPGLLSVAGLLTLLGAAMIRSSRRLIGGIN